MFVQVIVTEGEYDAMAVAQALSELPGDHPFKNVPAISLPNGCNSLPLDLVKQLEQFEQIYLWMDNDKSGLEGSEKFAGKLGTRRVLLVKPDPSMKVPQRRGASNTRNCNK
jgi:twinkle protein